jgi:hypothetical protein
MAPSEVPVAEVVKESDMVLPNDYKKDVAEAQADNKPVIEPGFGSGPSAEVPIGTGDIGSKIFTTPPAEVQNEEIKPGETEDATPGESEESNGSDDKKDQVIFEPTPDEDKEPADSNPDKESPDPFLDSARDKEPPKEPEVATVTEIGPNDSSVANPNGSVPETPGSSSALPAEMTKSNTLVGLIVAAIIVLLVVGGIAFYIAFIKK